MRFKEDFLRRYLAEAPAALAVERYQECQILSGQPFERPILDLGCGEGLLAQVLFDEKVDAGLDPDKRDLRRAERWGAYDELLCCRGSDIPKPDGAFKTVFSNSVLEHILDVEAVLREIRRVLAPEGRFYATVPTHLFERYNFPVQLLNRVGLLRWAQAYRGFFNRFWRHYHAHTPEGWAALFERCGFRVLESRQYCSKHAGLIEDGLTPLALWSLLVKKIANRWFLIPPLRRALAPALAALLDRPFRVKPGEREGGIIFFSLERKP